jgi:hypothetical protein
VIEPVGSCYYARDYFTRIQEYAPCRQERSFASSSGLLFSSTFCHFKPLVTATIDSAMECAVSVLPYRTMGISGWSVMEGEGEAKREGREIVLEK